MKSRANKASFWSHHIEQWRESDQSKQSYCDTHQLSAYSFCYWQSRLGSSIKKETLPSLIPVVVEPEDPSNAASSQVLSNPSESCDSGIELSVGQTRIGVRCGFDVSTLKQVLQCLKEV